MNVLRQMYLSQRDDLDVPAVFEALGALPRPPSLAMSS
jgi:hypothetical protein